VTAAGGPLTGIPIVRIILESLPLAIAHRTMDDHGLTLRGRSIRVGAREIELRTIATPGGGDASTQGLFVPDGLAPDSAPGWPAGRYVFVVRGAPGSYERWFGVEVLPWVGDGQDVSPAPTTSPTIP
jgi:hypothetical protein